MIEEKKYLTVTALTRYLKKKLDIDRHLQHVHLTGEISNFRHHSSGHMYLTIKDNQTRIRAVMFAGNNHNLKFMPENGMKILVMGTVSIYETDGEYQIIIKQMEPDGIGALFIAYEQLKEKLTKEGIFNPESKVTIPTFPTHVGVITSPTGAAVRDIITTIKRRSPNTHITIIPVSVQGSEATDSIEAAIIRANQLNVFDTLIVGRGGGSIEDLWSFNEEKVVRAIYNSTIPIISAVGHETDVTLSDFASDLRAATPTAAAELAVPSLLELNNKLGRFHQLYTDKINLLLAKRLETLQRITSSYGFSIPEQKIIKHTQLIDKLNDGLHNNMNTLQKNKFDSHRNLAHRLAVKHPGNRITADSSKLAMLQTNLQNKLQIDIEKKRQAFQLSIEKLTLLNPLHIIKRGYAIPYQANHDIVKSIHDITMNEPIEIRLIDGIVKANVTEIQEELNHE